MEYLISDAHFSPDEKYRYWLKRIWDTSKPVLNSVGLNPSKAGKKTDDPTIKREVGLAFSLGYGGLCKYNLFAKVTPNPKRLGPPEIDPIGPENDLFLFTLAEVLADTVFCWGSWNGRAPGFKVRADELRKIFTDAHKQVYCFGTNQDGEPKHPLYLPSDAKLIRY